MRYSKIIPIFVVSIMIISGISSMAGARLFKRSNITEEINEEGEMKLLESRLITEEIFVIKVNRPSDINAKFKGYFPINLDDFSEDFKTDGLKVKFTGKLDFPSIISRRGIPVFIRGYLPIKLSSIEKIVEKPELVFDISIDNSFLSEDTIPVEATITNRGETPLKVSKLSLEGQSLDFNILTPDNKELHYIGGYIRCYPEHIILKPGQKHSKDFDITNDENPFGENKDRAYDFSTKGVYEITGRYTSYPNVCDETEEGLMICLESSTYMFEIKDEIQKTATLTLSTTPAEVSNEVFTYTEPLKILPILDGKIHAVYNLDTEVSIKVDESFGDYLFERFSMDATGSDSEITIMMDSNKSVIAHYKKDTPDPVPPEACFTYTPELPVVGTEVVFNSDCSTDQDGEIMRYIWDFGDGTVSEEKNPIHQYSSEGEYKVTLTVEDNDDLRARYSRDVTVEEDEAVETGLVFGTIREASIVEVQEKQPIADAKIEIVSTGRTKREHYSTTSNEIGEYELEVKIGEYKIIVEKQGYKPKIKTVLVEADTSNEVNFVLEKQDAELEFDISLESTIVSRENPLSLTASIKNNEETSVEVSEIGIDIKTLRLQIRTPDGKVLITKPGRILTVPPTKIIEAKETYSVHIDDLTEDDFIILSSNGEESSETQDFTPGEYVIKGIYTSWGPRDGRWHGRLVSNEETFVFK